MCRSNISKILYGPPLYRQEKMWDDLGLVLPRNMMANWCIKISQYYLEPLYRLMLDKIKESSRLIHCDETTIQVNKEENKKASSNSYMWVITTGKLEKMQGVIFKYSSSRSSEVVKELLKGYKNILVTDGYAGYNILDEEVTHAECWAHARRKFYDSIPLVNRQMDKTSAVYYSFIETAKLNKLNIYKYINYLLEILPQLEGEQKDTDIEKYLPWSEELPDEIRNYEEEWFFVKLVDLYQDF